MAPDEERRPELVLYCCREAYFYAPIPPAPTIGHRAELWGVDDWVKALVVKVVSSGDDLSVVMFDQDTGEEYAQCPVPNDKQVSTAIEPVVDSSRYFVLKVVDRASGRHAFVGLGFRERNDASDFNAAIAEHRQYLERKKEAAKMHQHYVQDERPKKDYSLKPGQTLHVQVPKHSSPVSTGSLSEKLPAGPMPVVSTSGTGALKITPPPAPPGPRTSQPPLSARGEAPPLLGDDGEDAVGRPAGGSEQAVPKDGTGDGSSHGLPVIPTDPDEGEDGRAAGGGAEATPGGAQAGGEDDWGDFVG